MTAIGNVGDDLEMWDLHVSPDLDTIMYTLAGLLDEERGWGVRGDTYQAMAVAEQAGRETWFTLGDQDAGLHMLRTRMLKKGEPLSTVTQKLAEGLEVGVRLLPATDDRLRTKIQTADGELDFQEWFVRRRHADRVDGVRFEGAEESRPAPGVVDAIAEADVVVIAPSNPFVSIRPILAVPGIEEALRAEARRCDLAARRREGAARPARRDDGKPRARARRGRGPCALRRPRLRLRARPGGLGARGRDPRSRRLRHGYGFARAAGRGRPRASGGDRMIGIVGGTGDFGQGLAERLRRLGEEVELGSRTPHDEFVSNRDCAQDSDIVFLSVPPEGLAEMCAQPGREPRGEDCRERREPRRVQGRQAGSRAG